MTPKMLVLTLGQWPRARNLLEAMEVPELGWNVPFFMCRVRGDHFSSARKKSGESPGPLKKVTALERFETSLVEPAVVSKLEHLKNIVGQTAYGDPFVEKEVLSNRGRLGISVVPGASYEQLVETSEADGYEVVSLTNLFDERRTELPPEGGGFKDEGFLDWHQIYRERWRADGVDDAEILARTLAETSWRNHSHSGLYYILGLVPKLEEICLAARKLKGGKYAKWSTALAPLTNATVVIEAVSSIALGMIGHPTLVKHFARILADERHVALCGPPVLARMVHVDRKLEKQVGVRAAAIAESTGARAYFDLVEALAKANKKGYTDQRKDAVRRCLQVRKIKHMSDDDLRRVLAVAGKLEPEIACRALVRVFDYEETDPGANARLVRLVTGKLPKKKAGDAVRKHLVPLARRARNKALNKALERLYKKFGIETEGLLKPPPRKVADVDETLLVTTDGGGLALYDWRSVSEEELATPSLLDAVNAGRVVAWQTGGDGTFAVRVTGGELTRDENVCAGASADLAVAVEKGELSMTGGQSSVTFAVPKGKYAAKVTAIAVSEESNLPDYVVRLRKTTRPKLAKRAELDLIEP